MSADQTPAADPTPGLSRVDVAGLRAAAEAATPGPWRHTDSEVVDDVWEPGLAVVDPEGNPVALIADEWYEADEGKPTPFHDAAFIAAARNALPALLDERDDLAARLATAEAEGERMRALMTHDADDPECIKGPCVYHETVSELDGQIARAATAEAEVERLQRIVMGILNERDLLVRSLKFERRRAEVAERQVQAVRDLCASAQEAGASFGIGPQNARISVSLLGAALAPLDPDAPTGRDGHGEADTHQGDTEACVTHRPIQHRDGKPPWCRACGLTGTFDVPVSVIGKGRDTEARDGR